MKRYIVIVFLLTLQFSKGQGFLIYDANDYINPSWFDPKYTGVDSIKKVYFLTMFGGTGLNVNSVTNDDVFPNFYYNNFWFAASLYCQKTQISVKNSFEFGGVYHKKDSSYSLYRNYNPEVQIAIYPQIYHSKSYLNQQLRLQLSWSPKIVSYGGNQPTRKNSLLSLQYGGFITNSYRDGWFPRTAVLAQIYQGLQKGSFFTYGFTIFSEIATKNTSRMLNTLYWQCGYNRQNQKGFDRINQLRLGIVEELIYDKDHNFSVYFFANYNVLYKYNASITEINTPDNKHEINLGLFFNFPIHSHFYYKY